jgi:hypothetical protein
MRMNNTGQMLRKIVYVLVGIAVVVGGLFFAWRFFTLRAMQANQNSPVSTSVAVQNLYEDTAAANTLLVATNPAYAQGNQLMSSGQYTAAAQQYRAAVSQTTDLSLTEQATSQFALASADAAAGNYTEAVATYENIAASTTTLSNLARAYAVQYLGLIYYSSSDPAVAAEIFNDPSYAPLFVSGDERLSLRNLFDYAASIYPLASSELYSADWYVDNLPAATSTQTQYLNTISQKLALASQDIAYLRAAPLQSYISYALVNALDTQAVVLGKLQILGQTRFADPDQAFMDLMSTYATFHLQYDGMARLHYAIYLSDRYGSSRAQDIKNLLAPIETNPSSTSLYIVAFLKNEQANRWGEKADLVALSTLDPNFKTLLTSLGWSAADFTRK